jgi:hypothetical protein
MKRSRAAILTLASLVLAGAAAAQTTSDSSVTRTDVIARSPERVLTLVTGYPFRFVRRAPLRFVVRARRFARLPAKMASLPAPRCL